MKTFLTVFFAIFFTCLLNGQTIGIRANNPTCIRYYKANNWKGQVGSENGFAKFSSPEYGFRAAAIIAKKRIKENMTIQQIIEKNSPASDSNPVKKYTSFVCQRMGKQPSYVLKESDLPAFLAALSRFESGKEWDMAIIERGISLAR